MTPLQAEMLASTLAMTASIIADEFLDVDRYDSHHFQQIVAKECLKSFRQCFRNVRLITPDPPSEKLIKPPKKDLH